MFGKAAYALELRINTVIYIKHSVYQLKYSFKEVLSLI